jgi:hypothetical protein
MALFGWVRRLGIHVFGKFQHPASITPEKTHFQPFPNPSFAGTCIGLSFLTIRGFAIGSIFNSILWLQIDPALQNKQKHLPRMQNGFNAESGFVFSKNTASGISNPESIATKYEIFSLF